jgi:HAD superfamily hydrolase (TIGR01509 family)
MAVRRMPQLDAILFDMGGTLDGRGAWRERFERAFAGAGVVRARDERMRAFDYAEQRAHAAGAIATARLRDHVSSHVGWQFEALGIDNAAAARAIADRFVAETDRVRPANCRMLAALHAHGYTLGLVSNACGNASTLCEEFGYAPYLSVIADSHHVGVSKPDPGLFWHALRGLDVPPARAGFVGDSLDHDIRPAKALGMWTCWVTDRPLDPAAAAIVDAVVEDVADVPVRLAEVACGR